MSEDSREQDAQKILVLVASSRDSVLSAWSRAAKVSRSKDFLALVEDAGTDCSSVICGPRVSMLALMAAKGLDVNQESINLLREPAKSDIPNASCIWVVLRLGDMAHVAKIIQEPVIMSQGGQA